MLQRRSVLALAAPLLMGAGEEDAAAVRAKLSPAQIALFETPHLAALHPPVRLDYTFRRDEAGKDPVEDTIRLEVRGTPGQDGKREVVPEFFTGPRAIHYPSAHGFGGNPLLVFALDRDARELSAATGGTANWFRNRFRNALASAADVRPDEVDFDGRRLRATRIALTPFTGEPRAGRYQERRYAFILADGLPGVFHTIRTDLPAAGDDRGAVAESIVFAGTAPLPEGAG